MHGFRNQPGWGTRLLMADNVTADPGSGGATFKTDEDTGVTAHVPITKIELGVDGSFDGYLSTTNPMPSAGNVAHDAVDSGNPIKVGGKAYTTLPTAAATADRVDQTMTTQGGALVAGTDGTTPRNVAVNASGQLEVDISAQQGAALDVSGATVTTTPAVTGGGTEATAQRVTIASDSTGVLSVDDNGSSLTVDNAGTFATQVDGAALTALQLIDDPVATDDTSTHTAATTKVMGIGAVATPTDTTVDANDIGMPAMSTDRRLLVDAQIVGQDADVTIADGGNNISVDWAGTVPPIGAGTEAAALRVTLATDSTGVVSVDDNGSSITVDTAGGALDVSGATVTVDLGANNDVQGATAHDAAVSGNPFLLAGEARTTTPTAVADGDVVRLQADDQGRLVVAPHAPRDLTVHNRITLTTTSETTLIAAGGAGVFRDLVFLSLSNESATEVRVDIADATAGSDRISIDLAADGGGAIIPFPVPLTQATANNNWTATLSGAVSTVYITAIAVARV